MEALCVLPALAAIRLAASGALPPLLEVATPRLGAGARRDELSAAWSIFTPLLHAIDDNKHAPLKYSAG